MSIIFAMEQRSSRLLELIDALPYYDNELETVPGMAKRVQGLIHEQVSAITKEQVEQYRRSVEETIQRRLGGGNASTRNKSKLSSGAQEFLARLESEHANNDPAPHKRWIEFHRTSYTKGLEPPDDDGLDLKNKEQLEQHLQAWKNSTERLKIMIEHHSTWLANEELRAKYGPMAWQAHSKFHQGILECSRRQEGLLTEQVNSINRKRKAEQLRGGRELEQLKQSYRETLQRSRLLGAEIAKLHHLLSTKPTSHTTTSNDTPSKKPRITNPS